MKYFLLLAVSLVALGYAITTTRTATQREIVYAICNQSRTSASIKETQCGDLQTAYGIEFICTERNTSVNNHCWTEVNNELKED